MSDADFAKLQADRDAAPRGAQKANLHKRVQNEIARRKAGSIKTPESKLGAPEGTEARQVGRHTVLYQDGKQLGYVEKVPGESAWSGYTVHSPTGKQTGHVTTLDSGLRQIKAQHDAQANWGKPKVAETPKPGTRDVTEQKVAKAQWSGLSAAARKHGGMVGPPEGGTVTVHFPIPHRAAGFYDQMISAYLSAEFKTGTKTVRVHKP